MTPDDSPEPIPSDTRLFTRRRALLSVATGAGTLMVLPAMRAFGAPIPRLSDDDDDDDHDNSGSGSDDHDDDDSSSLSDDEGDVAPSGTVPPGSIEVRIVDDDADGFQPSSLTIDAGQSVTFVNQDDDAHTATGAEFDTGIFQPGDQVTVTFDEPGSFPYSCLIHPVMIGEIIVLDADGNVPASPAASPGAATPQSATPGAATAAASSGSTVTIQDFAFDPPEIEVAVGATVTWTNRDQVPHTATANDGTFDTGILDEGQSGEYTFDTAGRFEYVCALHPNMTGVVVVA